MATAITEARDVGVDRLVTVCVEPADMPRLLEYCSCYEGVSTSIGLHPNVKNTEPEPSAEELARVADDPRIVAIGETGLDYYRMPEHPAWQRKRFRAHIRASVLSGKPLIVHCRNAKEDTLRLLEEEGATAGVMHCFVEDWITAQRAIELGFYISFSGILTFKNAAKLRETACKIPIERLLVETDSPYLAPVPHRGHGNQPAYVRYVVHCLAELRHRTLAELARQTTLNSERLFGI